ncbi:MAG: ATP-binding protein [Methanoregula sp.]
MIVTPAIRRQAFWTVLILATTFFAVYSTIFSLTHGIYDVYPFLYFLPIILFVYQYPRWGVLFSLFMSTIYLLLVYYFSNFDPGFIAVSTAWFVIFVTIGVVTSSFAEGLREEERKYRGIFENSQAGIFTFDIETERIRELNNKCARMLKYEKEDLINKDFALILPNAYDRDAFISEVRSRTKTGDNELRFQTRDATVRHFLLSASLSPDNIVICSVIDITERKLAERVIQKAKDDLEQRVRERTDELLRANDALKMEIQERRRFESAIQLANRKLNTLSSITRHDILNQITAIVMYLSLAEEITTENAVLEHLQKIEQLTDLIQAQIRFTKDYQSIGANAPQWQLVSATVRSAIKNVNTGNVRVENELGNLEIYADYLLEKVFFNLVDNSLRHGEKVTVCRFSYRKDADAVTIIYEDNGIGVPANAKDKIFKREYYRNTGYGMFLSHEILSITSLTIRETGEPGEGARFEIHVPEGEFRFAADNIIV